LSDCCVDTPQSQSRSLCRRADLPIHDTTYLPTQNSCTSISLRNDSSAKYIFLYQNPPTKFPRPSQRSRPRPRPLRMPQPSLITGSTALPERYDRLVESTLRRRFPAWSPDEQTSSQGKHAIVCSSNRTTQGEYTEFLLCTNSLLLPKNLEEFFTKLNQHAIVCLAHYRSSLAFMHANMA
jgi:hypothetical protein